MVHIAKKKKTAYNFKTIFRGETLRIVGFDMHKPNVLMTFTRRASNPPHQPFSPGLAKAYGWGFVAFVSLQNHWWQTPELPAAFACAKEHMSNNAKIVTYGTSMGGAGAILASQFVDVHRCVAIAAPLIIDQAYSPWEERYQDSWEGLEVLHSPDFEARQPKTTYVAYDPFYSYDNLHVRKMHEDGLKLRRLPLPFSGHVPLNEVLAVDRYRDLTEALIIKGDYQASKRIFRETRDARGTFSYSYLQKNISQDPEEFDEIITAISNLIKAHGRQEFLVEGRADRLFSAERYAEAHADYADLFERTKRKKFLKMMLKSEILASRQDGVKVDEPAKAAS